MDVKSDMKQIRSLESMSSTNDERQPIKDDETRQADSIDNETRVRQAPNDETLVRQTPDADDESRLNFLPSSGLQGGLLTQHQSGGSLSSARHPSSAALNGYHSSSNPGMHHSSSNPALDASPFLAPHRAAEQKNGFAVRLARKFDCDLPTEIKWSHATNTKVKLEEALSSDVHMLEADVSFGPYDDQSEPSNTIWNACLRSARNAGAESGTGRDGRSTGRELIMAHPPQQPSSNLTFREFCEKVKEHNLAVDRLEEQRNRSRSGSLPATLLANQLNEFFQPFQSQMQSMFFGSENPGEVRPGQAEGDIETGDAFASMNRDSNEPVSNQKDLRNSMNSGVVVGTGEASSSSGRPRPANGTAATGAVSKGFNIRGTGKGPREAAREADTFLPDEEKSGKPPRNGSRNLLLTTEEEPVRAFPTVPVNSPLAHSDSPLTQGSPLTRGEENSGIFSQTFDLEHLQQAFDLEHLQQSGKEQLEQLNNARKELAKNIEDKATEAKKKTEQLVVNVGKALGLIITRKGIKLDFKKIECVRPAIDILLELNMADHVVCVMLNGDVMYGPLGAPGIFAPPSLNGEQFVQECSRVKKAALSLGWMTTDFAMRHRHYRKHLIEGMIKICERRTCWDEERQCVRALKDMVSHLTFPVNGPYVIRSKKNLHTLMERLPNASLTVFTGSGSMGISENTLNKILAEFDNDRLFLDVRTQTWVGLCCGNLCGYCMGKRSRGEMPGLSEERNQLIDRLFNRTRGMLSPGDGDLDEYRPADDAASSSEDDEDEIRRMRKGQKDKIGDALTSGNLDSVHYSNLEKHVSSNSVAPPQLASLSSGMAQSGKMAGTFIQKVYDSATGARGKEYFPVSSEEQGRYNSNASASHNWRESAAKNDPFNGRESAPKNGCKPGFLFNRDLPSDDSSYFDVPLLSQNSAGQNGSNHEKGHKGRSEYSTDQPVMINIQQNIRNIVVINNNASSSSADVNIGMNTSPDVDPHERTVITKWHPLEEKQEKSRENEDKTQTEEISPERKMNSSQNLSGIHQTSHQLEGVDRNGRKSPTERNAGPNVKKCGRLGSPSGTIEHTDRRETGMKNGLFTKVISGFDTGASPLQDPLIHERNESPLHVDDVGQYQPPRRDSQRSEGPLQGAKTAASRTVEDTESPGKRNTELSRMISVPSDGTIFASNASDASNLPVMNIEDLDRNVELAGLEGKLPNPSRREGTPQLASNVNDAFT